MIVIIDKHNLRYIIENIFFMFFEITLIIFGQIWFLIGGILSEMSDQVDVLSFVLNNPDIFLRYLKAIQLISA